MTLDGTHVLPLRSVVSEGAIARRVRGKATPGPTAVTVAANVKRLRVCKGLSLRKLSARLSDAGWPISIDGLNKIEMNRRRVDADDLMALASALGVNPNALLLADRTGASTECVVTGLGVVPIEDAWDWARGLWSRSVATSEVAS